VAPLGLLVLNSRAFLAQSPRPASTMTLRRALMLQRHRLLYRCLCSCDSHWVHQACPSPSWMSRDSMSSGRGFKTALSRSALGLRP
jgi:hypothetical protein